MSELVGLTVNGLAFGMMLFLLASGLTLIFGLMGYINLAHGSVYLLTAYIAIDVSRGTGQFVVGVLAAIGVGCLLGLAIYLMFLRTRPHLFRNPLAQVLLSFGLIFLAADVAQTRWRGLAAALPSPASLSGSVHLLGASVTVYRLALIALGVGVSAALWLVERRTMFGAAVRAGVDDSDMLASIGFNPHIVFLATFVAGFGFAGLAGGLGAPILGSAPGVEYTILLYAIPIVVIGGLGSLPGAFVASLLVGLIDSLGRAWLPELSLFLIFLIVVGVLTWRPTGLVPRA
jgi:branched-chain amino acid transport system permease protein